LIIADRRISADIRYFQLEIVGKKFELGMIFSLHAFSLYGRISALLAKIEDIASWQLGSPLHLMITQAYKLVISALLCG
jgi:hypothetical protein